MREPTAYERAILWALNQKAHVFGGIENAAEYRKARRQKNRVARASRRANRRK